MKTIVAVMTGTLLVALSRLVGAMTIRVVCGGAKTIGRALEMGPPGPLTIIVQGTCQERPSASCATT